MSRYIMPSAVGRGPDQESPEEHIMTHETWRTYFAQLGIRYQEDTMRRVIEVFGRDGGVAAVIRPQEYRSGAGGYIFRHTVSYPGGSAQVDLAHDLTHAAHIAAYQLRYTSAQPRPYTGR